MYPSPTFKYMMKNIFPQSSSLQIYKYLLIIGNEFREVCKDVCEFLLRFYGLCAGKQIR